MNLSELRSEVYNRLDETANDFFSDDEINLWLNEVYHEIGEETLRFKETVELTTIADESFYELPNDFVREIRVMYDGSKLEKISFDKKDNGDTGYLIWENDIELSPMPNGTNLLKLYYFKTPAELTTDTDNIDDKQVGVAMIYYALAQAKRKDRQFVEAREYEALYNRKLLKIAKKHSNAPRRKTMKVIR